MTGESIISGDLEASGAGVDRHGGGCAASNAASWRAGPAGGRSKATLRPPVGHMPGNGTGHALAPARDRSALTASLCYTYGLHIKWLWLFHSMVELLVLEVWNSREQYYLIAMIPYSIIT